MLFVNLAQTDFFFNELFEPVACLQRTGVPSIR